MCEWGSVCMCVCEYIWVCMYECVNMCMYMTEHVHEYVYVHVCVCECVWWVCMSVCMCMIECVCTYVCVFMHIQEWACECVCVLPPSGVDILYICRFSSGVSIFCSPGLHVEFMQYLYHCGFCCPVECITISYCNWLQLLLFFYSQECF